MPEINLLPDDLRGKEKKELESVSRKPKVVEVEMSSPQKDKIDQPLKTSKPSLMSRIFSRQKKKASLNIDSQENVQQPSDFGNSSREEKKIFTTPKIDLNSPDDDGKDIFAAEEPSHVSSVAPKQKSYAIKEEEAAPVFDSSSQSLSSSPRKEKLKLFSRQQKPVKQENFREKPDKKKKEKRRRGDEDESILELNLIPDELSKYPELEFPKKVFRSGLSIFLTILVVIGAYLGITWYQLNINSKIEGLEQIIIDVNEDIGAQEAIRDNSQDLQKRLSVIEGLLSQHVYWTQFFNQLEKNTLPQVYYLGFAMTGTERVVLSAITDSYSSVAEQIVTFEKADNFVKTVDVSGAAARFSQEDGSLVGVDFNVELEFQPGVFLKSSGN